MKSAPSAVTQTVTLDLFDETGDTRSIEAGLHYCPRDPFAVTCSFRLESVELTWTFARDLVVDGLLEPTGDGDVHVWPSVDQQGNAVVVIELYSVDGMAVLQGDAHALHQFVRRSMAEVERGTEARLLDVDAAIEALLRTGAGA